jgi:UDP-N-acetylglucosamine 2-epimerase (non-hydrolysing)
MSEVFKQLDANFNHILVHSGQHYDRMMSDVFFDELEIREPDYNLHIGGPGIEHYRQTGRLSGKIIELLRKEKIHPDIILFLGDSNSVLCAVPLAKEGYQIGHIEAGMRSYDRRMLEEINRVVCDHVSNHLFVYHEEYEAQALAEGIPAESIHVVGNTIVEPCLNASYPWLFVDDKADDQILLDIHRPENFNDSDRLHNILDFASYCRETYNVPVRMLNFGRTQKALEEMGINSTRLEMYDIEPIDLMSYKTFLVQQYHSLFIISDSGTAQEEPALLKTPVIVPRDFTERPQSVDYGCSYMLNVNDKRGFNAAEGWMLKKLHFPNLNPIDSSWLGDGQTSRSIVRILKEVL